MLKVRKTKPEDLESVMRVYAYAREQMKKNGNPTQWGEDRPGENTIVSDIEAGNSYVVAGEGDGEICGVFAFIIGDDPTYRKIENGAWKNDHTYGTIHRLASNGKEKGIFQACLQFCEQCIPDIRADTHQNNRIMQYLLEKAGYERCGIIFVEDGSPRIAYQKTIE
jgi:RimJ/RimL family protein N-acetyltransferase